MSRWALVFLVLAAIAGLLGFGGEASSLAGFAQMFFFFFLAMLLVSIIAGLLGQEEDARRRTEQTFD